MPGIPELLHQRKVGLTQDKPYHLESIITHKLPGLYLCGYGLTLMWV
jgi:hypothetical protein